MKIVITGGHHTSALPIIKLLKQDYKDVKVVWFGQKNTLKGNKNLSLEYLDISSLNIPFYEIHAGKFYKTFNIVRLLKIPFGFFQALYLLQKEKPDVVLSFGGYIAVPVAIAAYIYKIPVLTHEQTVTAGYANRLISKFAKKVLVSWESSVSKYPKDKVIYTGLPVRDEIFEIRTTSFLFANMLPTIYITAGKTGSNKINKLIEESLSELLTFSNIIHQTGDNSVFNDFERLQNKYTSIKDKVPGVYVSRKFVLEDEIGEAFNRSSLVISRSGAHTIFDLMSLDKPSLLIPISWVSHNEQFENAKLLKDLGIAEIMEENTISKDKFIDLVSTMLRNLSKYKLKSKVKRLDSARLIIDEIFKYSKKG